MIDQTNLRRYAEKLVRESELFSEEERVGYRILDLIEHAHNPEMVVDALKRDVLHAQVDGDDTVVLRKVIKHIKEG